ncbi:MAG TPA: hypothetical protein VGH28_28290 [Polyangiaceae bacterium]|jgi:spore photoproduct lyase
MSASVLGVGRPNPMERVGPWIKHFPGGKGHNNCPRFYYVRDGFGCTYNCHYCYLRRFENLHPDGAEFDPKFERLYSEVKAWMKRPGRNALLLGEVTDGWGWTHIEKILERNLQLIVMFRAQQSHTLITLTKDSHVMQRLAGITPTDRVVLSWSLNPPAIADLYEMGAKQAEARIADAARAREAGWRVRVRIDPMIPIAEWQRHYAELANVVRDRVRPELVTCGSWRPRPQDPMMKSAPPEMTAHLEKGPDGRLRLKNRIEMYETVWAILGSDITRSLCKEELDVEAWLYTEHGEVMQACNCLGEPVVPVSRLHVSAALQARARVEVRR